MTTARLFPLVLAALLPGPAWNQDDIPAVNVNSRYKVESVELTPRFENRLSRSLRRDLQRLVGESFNPDLADRVASRIRRELARYTVTLKVAKGAKEEHVKLVFEVERRRDSFEVILPHAVYHSKQNFSFGADAKWRIGASELNFGALTDSDTFLERYSGIRGGFARSAAAGRVSVGFRAESYRAQWNGAVRQAADGPAGGGIYRARTNFEPYVSAAVLRPLTLRFGVSLQDFELQFPAARDASANAWIGSLRFDQHWEDTPLGTHAVEAGYSLRAATSTLSSDYRYTRHTVDAAYRFSSGKEVVKASFVAGSLGGAAPLIERFVLGNSQTLRGWNKYDVAPLGGNRVAHGTLEYRHSIVRLFYDAGSVWTAGTEPETRQSIGIGLTESKTGEAFSVAVAFPIRRGRMEPILILGMNF